MNFIQREGVRFWNRGPLTFFPGENCFVWGWRAGEARPPTPHKTLSMHGARTSAPRRGADPSAAKGLRSLSANQMNFIQREGVRFWNRGPLTFFPRANCFVWGWRAGEARPPTPHKTLSMHGARTSAPRPGADPSAAKMLLRTAGDTSAVCGDLWPVMCLSRAPAGGFPFLARGFSPGRWSTTTHRRSRTVRAHGRAPA